MSEHEIQKTLDERGDKYGTFEVNSKLQIDLWDLWYSNGMSPSIRVGVFYIFGKMARALAGDPNYDDNYIDIGGYAKLMLDLYLKDGRKFEVHESYRYDVNRVIGAKKLVSSSPSYKICSQEQRDLMMELTRDIFSIYNGNQPKQKDFEGVLRSVIDLAKKLELTTKSSKWFKFRVPFKKQ